MSDPDYPHEAPGKPHPLEELCADIDDAIIKLTAARRCILFHDKPRWGNADLLLGAAKQSVTVARRQTRDCAVLAQYDLENAS